MSNRSGFVTGLAWTFIGLAGFATMIALLQNLMISLFFPVEEMRAAMREAEGAQAFPPFARFLFENFRLVFAAFLGICVLTLVSSIGLLLRKNWARILFIGIMACGILWNVASVLLPYHIFSSMPPMPPGTPPDFQAGFDILWKVMTAFTVIMAIAFCVLFGWIIRKLVSEGIRREFLDS